MFPLQLYTPFLSAMIAGNDFRLFPLAFIRAGEAVCESTTSVVGIIQPITAQSSVRPARRHQPTTILQAGAYILYQQKKTSVIFNQTAGGCVGCGGCGGCGGEGWWLSGPRSGVWAPHWEPPPRAGDDPGQWGDKAGQWDEHFCRSSHFTIGRRYPTFFIIILVLTKFTKYNLTVQSRHKE